MRIGIDIGGTFTDFVLWDEQAGALRTFKLLSTPDDPARAVLLGLQEIGDRLSVNGNRSTGLRPLVTDHRLLITDHGSPITDIIHGSTVATNALLERKGARTALVSTAGFRDVLAIGRQNRNDLYDFLAERPEPLVPAELRLEVAERIDRRGNVLTPLDAAGLPGLVEHLRALDVESVAVCTLFSFLNPTHEQAVAAVLRAAGFLVSPSCEILPEFREYERASTTTINAYVAPVLDRYLGRLTSELGESRFRIMQSNGGSISADRARREAVRSILSGPAGGVVGAFHIARSMSHTRMIAFDMGGTSTDVSLCDGAIPVTGEGKIGGLPVRVPLIDIHTVGAGGGSIARIDAGGALRVGPQSAGADPGPACYGRGGRQATVTDANLVLGRLAPEQFLGGEMALDEQAGLDVLNRLAGEAGLAALPGLSPAQTAALGVVQIANTHMERALRVISVERGYDPADLVLLSFGGAGGLHACDLARALGIRRVIAPPVASTLSAFGMLAADVVKDYVQTVMLPGTAGFREIREMMETLEQRGVADLAAEGAPRDLITLLPQVDIRYRGQSYELTVPLTAYFAQNFHAAHQRIYGHAEPSAALEIVNLRLRAEGAVAKPDLPELPDANGVPANDALLFRRPVVTGTGVAAVPFFDGRSLRPGQQLSGPAVVVQPDTTVWLGHGDTATVDRRLCLVIEIGAQEKPA
ncbi:MAG: hydantoinase/oxoprolinase family protein [Caldilineae bacterium]|nr:hydantoinase/oxoprolinase family protein [Caldilineae bacterium]